MGLEKAERAAVAATVLFLALTLGYRAGLRRHPAAFSVRTAAEGTAAITAAPDRLPGAPLVNINTAGREELCELSGIGETLAGRIIAYRDEHGPFARIEDITKVSGIGSGIFEGLRDCITVD